MKRGTSKGDDTIMEDTPEDPDKEGVEGTSVDKVEPKDAADKTAVYLFGTSQICQSMNDTTTTSATANNDWKLFLEAAKFDKVADKSTFDKLEKKKTSPEQLAALGKAEWDKWLDAEGILGDDRTAIISGLKNLEPKETPPAVHAEVQFIKLLQQAGLGQDSLNKNTMENLGIRYLQQMEYVNRLNSSSAAKKLYEDVLNLPGTSTKLIINEKLGLSVNGPWNQQIFGSIILTASEDGFPLLLKRINDNSSEAVSVKAIAHHNLDITVALVPCTVISTNIPNYTYEWTCLKMPTFIGTTEMLAQLTPRSLAVGGNRIVSALEILHNKNPPIIHMDVKPANIFVDMDGRWYLGDFGSSIIGIGKKIISTTTKFLPKGFSTQVDASFQFDYFMLLTSLAWLGNKEKVATVIMDPTNQAIDIAKLQIWIAALEDNGLKTLLLSLKEKALMFFN